MRLRFWKWVHDTLELAWHWVYYHKVKPNLPEEETRPIMTAVYFKEHE